MNNETLYQLMRGVQPEFADADWTTLKLAVDDLPELELSADFGTEERVAFAALDSESRGIFIVEFERGSDEVLVTRWPIPETGLIHSAVKPRRAGEMGPMRDRGWRFDLGEGRMLRFDSVEQVPDEFPTRLSRNEVFARALCRLLGWNIPA